MSNAYTIERKDGSTTVRFDGTTQVFPAELQPVPVPVVATVGHTMPTRDLAVLVEQEYRDQQLTPAMRMLLTRVGVFL